MLEPARPLPAGCTRPRQQQRPRQPRPPPRTSPGARPATVAMSQRAGHIRVNAALRRFPPRRRRCPPASRDTWGDPGEPETRGTGRPPRPPGPVRAPRTRDRQPGRQASTPADRGQVPAPLLITAGRPTLAQADNSKLIQVHPD